MPYSMPDAVCVSDAPRRLSRRRAGFTNARVSSWRVLCRLLLGTDGAVAGGRRDERVLDRPTCGIHSSGEGRSFRAPDRSLCWHNPRSGGCVVILNGNVLTAPWPAEEFLLVAQSGHHGHA